MSRQFFKVSCVNGGRMRLTRNRTLKERPMYRFAAVLFAIVLLGTAGCYTESVNPLFTDKDLVVENALLGRWTLENDQGATVSSIGEKAYRFTFEQKSDTPSRLSGPESIDFHVLRLGDHYFVDF